MSDYPSDLVRTRYLFDGSQVTIRPIRQEDAAMEQEFVKHLSPDSRYKRFMSTLQELAPGKLKYRTEIDYERHLALVAVVQRVGGAAVRVLLWLMEQDRAIHLIGVG